MFYTTFQNQTDEKTNFIIDGVAKMYIIAVIQRAFGKKNSGKILGSKPGIIFVCFCLF